MSLTINSALYYPRIEFQDAKWLRTAALVWDKIYRIQPDDFSPNESDDIKRLCENGDIGIPLQPKAYAKTVAEEFMHNINTEKWQAAALEKEQVKSYAKIHHDKIDVQIREMLISKGLAASNDQWLYVPEDFESLYMTYLAKKMGKKNNLQVVSDSDAAWTALTYYSTVGIDTENDVEQLPFALAALMIGNYLPANILDISPKELLKFREQYSDERHNFMRAMNAAAKQLANCHDAKIVHEIMRTIVNDVNKACGEFKRSMDVLKVESFIGFKTLAIPMAMPVLHSLLGTDFATLSILGATNIALGCIAGVASFKQKGTRLSAESDYSYLVHAENTFSGQDGTTYMPRRLNRNLNEFIND